MPAAGQLTSAKRQHVFPSEVRPWLDRYVGIYDFIVFGRPRFGAEMNFDLAQHAQIDERAL